MSREEIQSSALNAWIDNDCNGALILGTGVGKTKIAIDAIKYLDEFYDREFSDSYQPISVLWLTNSERLRDIDTPNDFKKWNADFYIDKIDFQCIQTAYKFIGESYQLVVVDEGDFMLTPEYFKFFENNTYAHILFLTATVDKNKQAMLDILCPTVFTYTTSQAQDEGILNKSTITLVNFMLDSTDKYIKVKGKGGKLFYQTENDAYEYLEKRCLSELLNVQTAKTILQGEILVNGTNIDVWEKKVVSAEVRHKFWTSKRANFLWDLKSSRNVAQDAIAKILEIDEHKILVFSKRVEQVEKICILTYHAKNKADNPYLDDLSKGTARCVGVVQAVNRGVNINGLTHLIFESYDGSSTSFQQRHGRGTRLAVNDVMKAYILVPHYKNKEGVTKPTQAIRWAKDMTSDFNNIKEVWI